MSTSGSIKSEQPDDTQNTFSDVDIERGANPVVAPKRTKKFIILIASVAALGGLIFGFDIAGAGATFVMDGFQYHFNWKCAHDDIGCVGASQGTMDRDKGLINGLFGIGAAIGALLNSRLAEQFGRRITLGLSALVFIFGASIQAWAPVMEVMWAGRIFSGMGIGMLSMCSPVYIGECAPEHIRGALGTLWQLAITIGIVLASAMNIGLAKLDYGWRISYGGNILFAVILILCLAFMPESPRWLAAHGTEEQVKESLSKMRFEDEIDSEVEKLQHEVEEERKLGQAPWSEVFSNKNLMRRRVILGFVLFAFQQLCGINAVMFYAPDILNTFFTESQAIMGTLVLNTINCLSTFITVATVDRFGRTKLLTLGGMLMFPCLVACGILSVVEQTQGVGYAVLVFAAIYIIGFAFSWGPVLWIVIPEMFPYRTRGKAVGICVMSNWIFTTLVGAVFPVASTASLGACFFFFAGAIFVAVGVVYFFQVETAEKTSEEIDQAYENHTPALKRKDW
ncbi:Facilitated trehalose transporter Tret1 [Seminavis robusta]|uniref:Hexose transporter 1 n=1 Tax=Seminavis robusta TaxID=568900 RepID=A0A9N8HZ42_9STRA|nr:Facilitated trehalose transporter Tret1 [Seminavis robusta]|eukprot:Sro2764_g336590.1 Facilitated trehalose transporter Tret1 (509) ;mRNA; f:3312-4838